MPVPFADARLFATAQALAPLVPDEGVVSYSLVEFAMQREGIIEPSPHLLVVWGNVDDPDGIIGQLAPRIPELLSTGADSRLGVGVARRNSNGDGVVVFALQGSRVRVAPIPRTLSVGGHAAINGEVAGTFHDPEVFVTGDDGNVVRLPLRHRANVDFATDVKCPATPGKLQVEIGAVDATGSTVLANFPIYCGVAPPTSVTIAPSVDDGAVTTPADAEKRMFELVNRDRVAAGLPELAWDAQVADVARSYSAEMRRTGIVAHVSPTSGNASDRVKRAGIVTSTVLENIARAYGVGEAHNGLMNSPGHRANVLSLSATHLGVGVVLGDIVSGRREVFVTEVFIRVPPHIDAARAAEQVRTKLNTVRPMAADPQLEAAAQGLAERLAAGVPRDRAWAEARKPLSALAERYARVGSVITTVGDLDSIEGDALLGGSKSSTVGIGIAQGDHPQLGPGAVWIVLLLGDRR